MYMHCEDWKDLVQAVRCCVLASIFLLRPLARTAPNPDARHEVEDHLRSLSTSANRLLKLLDLKEPDAKE